jgi:hypothetical protein
LEGSVLKTITAATINPDGPVSSRWEIIIHLLYSIPLIVVWYIYAIFALLGGIIQFFAVLVRGRRSVRISGFLKGFIDYYYRYAAYGMFLTDERPPVIP